MGEEHQPDGVVFNDQIAHELHSGDGDPVRRYPPGHRYLLRALRVLFARSPSPDGSTAESCALAYVSCAFFGDLLSVLGMSSRAGMIDLLTPSSGQRAPFVPCSNEVATAWKDSAATPRVRVVRG
jgi:hypothetical protein